MVEQQEIKVNVLGACSFGWKKITANSIEEVLQFFKTSKKNFSFWPLYEEVKPLDL